MTVLKHLWLLLQWIRRNAAFHKQTHDTMWDCVWVWKQRDVTPCKSQLWAWAEFWI